MIDWMARGLANRLLTSLSDYVPLTTLTQYVKTVDLPPTSFVSTTPMTVASLLSTYPAGSTYLGKYARVTDLYGNVDEIMRCSSDGSTYYWRPQRADYAISNASTSGTVSLSPLVTPPQIFLIGSLVGNVTITPSSTNAWPGAQFTVTAAGALNLFSINISGLVGASVPLLTGSSKVLTYTASGWRSN